MSGDHITYCTNCGNEMPAGAAFCPSCGRSMNAQAPATTKTNGTTAVRTVMPPNIRPKTQG
ncbi:MAG: zinc-ribbon domain-containing protein [Candidatus Methanoplasma sp.]|nr:zinc-ribbon domain-containing protein [Candidatus Methanoplasma sp.]